MNPRLFRVLARIMTGLSVIMALFLVVWVGLLLFIHLYDHQVIPYSGTLEDIRRWARWTYWLRANITGAMGAHEAYFNAIFGGVLLWAILVQVTLAVVLRALARAADRAQQRPTSQRSGRLAQGDAQD